jgi:hypothetical protein
MSTMEPDQNERDISEENSGMHVDPKQIDEDKEDGETKPARGLSDEVVEGETKDSADDPEEPE